MTFQQEDFVYQDLYAENSFLEDVVNYSVGFRFREEVKKDLAQFSKQAAGPVLKMMWQAEKNQPKLIQYDHWGKRIDQLDVDSAWDDLHAVAACEGMVAIGYERASGCFSRVHQFLKLMIFHPSSAFYTCPLAMTDGATRVMELENAELYKKYFKKMISRDPKTFWTAGQWMTEKTGGSDVSRIETHAEEKQGRYFLYGTKWFTSAVTSNIAMTLAQTQVGDEKKLTLFLVKIKDEQGCLNKIKILRLKDKLGTRAMPTAELQLDGVEGYRIGELGQGIKNIATILNLSRLYNSVCATGAMFRLHSLIRDYSKKRLAFGHLLMDHPLHQITLIKTQADTHACVHFITQMALELGRSELNESSDEERGLLRLMTPVAKLWTAKKSVKTISELIEAFGGAGYIEDTHLPRFLRDSQVFPIWEGTTNIMSLDTLRALKDKSCQKALSYIEKRLAYLSHRTLAMKLEKGFQSCQKWLKGNQDKPLELQFGARNFSFAIGDVFCGLLMLEFARKTEKPRDRILAEVFINNIVFQEFENHSSKQDDFKKALFE